MKVYILFILMLSSAFAIAQTKQQQQQLDNYSSLCSKYADSENYQALIANAIQGYKLANEIHQNKNINLFANYAEEAYSRLNKYDSSVYYNYAALQAAYAIQSEEKIADAQIDFADTYYSMGKPDSVKTYQQLMNDEVHTFKDSVAIISLYNELASINTYNNAYEKSLTAYMQLLHYYDYHHDKHHTAVTLVNIGNTFLQMSNSTKALPYFLRAMPLLSDYEYGQLVCSANIGAAYANLNMFDSAIVYYKTSMRIAEKLGDTTDVFYAYEKLGNAYTEKKDYNKAEQYLKPAIQYFQSTAAEKGIIDGEEFMGQLEDARKNFKSALQYFSDALNKAKSANYPERINELYKQLAQTADSAGLYKDAMDYYKKYIAINDSLNKESNQKNIAELETQYKTSQKEEQINLLNQKEKTQELNLKTQRNTTLFLIIGIALLGVLITLYIRYRNRLNQLKKLTEVRNNISRDLHDEIGATLSSINIYSEVARNKLSDNNDVQLLLQRIHDGSAQMMESMSDIVWYVNPKNDAAENTIIRMREYAAPVLEAKQVNIHFNVDEKISSIKLNMQQRQHLYLLFKEAINNIAKYAQAKNVFISINYINERMHVVIKDDGKGFDLHHHKQGNGLMNMRQRTELLHGKCSITSAGGNGTTIDINFPVSL